MFVLVRALFVMRGADSSEISTADNFFLEIILARSCKLSFSTNWWVHLFGPKKSSVSFGSSRSVLTDICNSFRVTKIRIACSNWTLLNTRPISENGGKAYPFRCAQEIWNASLLLLRVVSMTCRMLSGETIVMQKGLPGFPHSWQMDWNIPCSEYLGGTLH